MGAGTGAAAAVAHDTTAAVSGTGERRREAVLADADTDDDVEAVDADTGSSYRHYYYYDDDGGDDAGDDGQAWYTQTSTGITLTGALPPEWTATQLATRLRDLPNKLNRVVLDGFLRHSTDIHARDIVLALRAALRPRQVYTLVSRNLHLTRETAEALGRTDKQTPDV